MPEVVAARSVRCGRRGILLAPHRIHIETPCVVMARMAPCALGITGEREGDGSEGHGRGKDGGDQIIGADSNAESVARAAAVEALAASSASSHAWDERSLRAAVPYRSRDADT
jgi:hypothetical protein